MNRPRRAHHRVTIGVVALAALVLVGPGCRRAPGGGAAGSPADLAAIDRLRSDYVAARNAGDVDRLRDLWAVDGVLLPIDEPAVIGREAIAGHIADFLDQTPGTIAIEPDETRVAGDWAFERGRETITLETEASGEHVHLQIKYLAILVRQPDGSWKVGRYMYNLDESEPGEEETAESVTC
jgi:uncharacterized protein (TIGR02246 family)